jgi:phosphohistidine phosphatase
VRLYLLRHAKSSWDDPALADHDRPLAKRGRRAAKLIATHIRDEGIAPDLVLCSSSRRTRETLERIERALPRDTTTEIEEELYGATAEHLLGRLRELPGEVESALLIGHNPALQTLALDLAARGEGLELLRAKFPTAALATVELPGGAWAELNPGDGELVAYVRPRDLGPR